MVYTFPLRLNTTGDMVYAVLMEDIPAVGTIFVIPEDPDAERYEVVEIVLAAKPFYMHEVSARARTGEPLSPASCIDSGYLKVKRLEPLPPRQS